MPPKIIHMPMASDNNAPRFYGDATGFKSFFEDVETLAKRAGLSDIETIRWAICYAGREGEFWEHVPCYANYQPAPQPAPVNQPAPVEPTLEEFREEVLKSYPHLDSDWRYTYQDLKRLVSKTQECREMTRELFGEYYRKFIILSLGTRGHLPGRQIVSFC